MNRLFETSWLRASASCDANIAERGSELTQLPAKRGLPRTLAAAPHAQVPQKVQ